MKKSKEHPNILFLMSDEHRADVTGYEGNPVVRTPVLDELARTAGEVGELARDGGARLAHDDGYD